MTAARRGARSAADKDRLHRMMVYARSGDGEPGLAEETGVFGECPHLLVDAALELFPVQGIARFRHAAVAGEQDESVVAGHAFYLVQQPDRLGEVMESREQHDAVERGVREGRIGALARYEGERLVQLRHLVAEEERAQD